MKSLDEQLKLLFSAAKPVRQTRLNDESQAPFGFAGRVAAIGKRHRSESDSLTPWAAYSRWGFALACGLLVITLFINRGLFNPQWSPAMVAAEEVVELVSLP